MAKQYKDADTIRNRIRRWLDEKPERAKLPIRTLARIYAETHPNSGLTVNSARNHFNAIFGRKESGKTYERPPGHQTDRPPIPEPHPNPYTGPHVMPPGRALILSDIHLPHHDPKALDLALGYRPFDYIVLAGDIMDCQAIGRFPSPPGTCASMVAEKQALKMFIKCLNWYEKPVYYYLGNHEERWWKQLVTRSPELAEDPDLSFEHYTGLDRLGVHMIPAGVGMKFGKLMGFHGHEVSTNSPFTSLTPAAWLLRQTQVSSFCGHFHRTGEHLLRRADGDVVGAWALGCLCNLNPGYRPRNQWNHGFAWCEFDESGFDFVNVKIIDGRVR